MNRIKMLREEFNFTQQDLANKLECSKSVIGLYESETRKPSMEVLLKLSEIFDCSIDYILGKSDIRNPEELKNIPHANSGGVDTTGLDEEDLKELQAQADYMKWKKQNKNENKDKNEDKK